MLEDFQSGWINVVTECEGACVTFVKYRSTKVIWKNTLPSTTSATASDSANKFEQLMPSQVNQFNAQSSQIEHSAPVESAQTELDRFRSQRWQVRIQFCSGKQLPSILT